MSEIPRLVCIDEACQLAGVTRRTLYNWMDANRVQFIRTAGGHRRVFVDSLFTDGNVGAKVVRKAVA